jgi:exodeoxyribonuclease VII small subunit
MTSKKQPADYQSLSQALDEVLAQLQQPDVPVDTAVELYCHGLELTVLLEKHLRQAENQLERLKLQETVLPT